MKNSYISFFFQAEDGIRDKLVTGVQTCALPISRRPGSGALEGRRPHRGPPDGALEDRVDRRRQADQADLEFRRAVRRRQRSVLRRRPPPASGTGARRAPPPPPRSA